MAKTPFISKDHEALAGIKRMLFAHRLSPGQKIIYRDLEDALGMSKTPIINALSRLEQEGLVVYQQNRGYFVRQLTTDEVEQMYDLRVKLDAIAMDYAVQHVDKKGLAELKKALDAYLSYDGEAYDAHRFQLDIAFHLQIARIGNNTFLTNMLVNFYETAWVGLPVAFLTPRIPNFRQFHVEMFEAIKNKDRRLAKSVAKRHWDTALKAVMQGYREP